MGIPAAPLATQKQGRSPQMKKTKMLGLVILVVFALSAIVATAAQAKSGPFFRIKGTRLVAGQKEGLTAKIQTATFSLKATGVTITCKKLSVKAGAEIIGSTGANSSTSKETIEFSECSLAGNGPNCKLEKTTITTEPVKNTLDYPKNPPIANDPKLILFQPEVGSVFVNIPVVPGEPKGCTVEGKLAVEGSVLGEAQNEKKEAFRLKVIVPETKNGLVHFPSKGTEACTEKENTKTKEGEVTCIKPKLTVSTKTATLEGGAELTLASGNIWGVLSE
jgi:hypothetical protein